MKKIFLLVLLIKAYAAHAQLPLPCLNYDETNLTSLQNFSGTRSARCIDIDMHSQPNQPQLTLSDNHDREFTVDEGTIHPGFTYEPGSDPNAQLSIVTGQRSEMEGVWLEPINYYPQLYEKIEWGVKLPAEVELAIDNWIHNDQHPDEPTQTPALNPFDPEQIDLQAIIDYWDENAGFHSQPIFGFFYREYERLTSYTHPENSDLADVNNWTWLEHSTAYRFRFRWASDLIAHHAVRIHLNVPSMGEWEMEPFEFDSYWGDPRNSFISVTNNKHYFKTVDGHVFFPVGLNINEGTFGCNCKEGFDDPVEDCSTCYELGENDPCCHINLDKRRRHNIPGTRLEDYTLAPAAYEKLNVVLEHLANVSGANAFRTVFDPLSFDIEFEKLNNYYERQFQAYEFDQMLSTCHDLNLRVDLNMQLHYSITKNLDFNARFDWDNVFQCTPPCGIDTEATGTNGWCYWHGCTPMDSPTDFLSNPCAISNYKKKLRYIIARWGFSKNIYLMELMSEMNNIGKGTVSVYDDVNGNGIPEGFDHDSNGIPNDGPNNSDNEAPPEPHQDVSTPTSYLIEQETVRPMVAWWHNEMARYIKQDLHHTRHLIAADFTGTDPMKDYNDATNACQSAHFDYSWESPYIDVIGWNNYDAALNRWEKMADHEYKKTNQTSGLLCGWNDPTEDDDNEGRHSPLNGYTSIWKPVVNPETGMDACMKDDYTGFVKDLLVGPFSGNASCGMSWDEWSSSEHWNMMGEVLEYLESNVLNDVDLGTETWVPDHVYSTKPNFPDQLAEAIYLRCESGEVPKFTGVILNRTWNFYTVGGSQCSDEQMLGHFTGNNVVLSDLTSFGWFTNKLVIEGAGSHTYTIRYFDPYTKVKIEEVNVTSLNGNLALQNYPLLHDGTDGHQPFYFFEAFEQGSEFDESQMTKESNLDLNVTKDVSNIVSNSSILDGLSNSKYNPELLFQVAPNPGRNYTMLRCSAKVVGHYISVFTSDGSEVGRIKVQTEYERIDFSKFESGVYFLVCPELELRTSYVKSLND